MLLHRPTGLEELLLIFATGMRAFPPRLPEQPIFYPVLTEAYASQLARDWNATSGSLAGYVTRFALDDTFASSFPVRTVGSHAHQELWVPADRLTDLNQHIAGRIEVVAAAFGPGFRGTIPRRFSLKGKDATTQLVTLDGIYRFSLMDFHGELAANSAAIFAHFPFWKSRSFADQGLSDARREALLDAIRTTWRGIFPDLSLSDV